MQAFTLLVILRTCSVTVLCEEAVQCTLSAQEFDGEDMERSTSRQKLPSAALACCPPLMERTWNAVLQGNECPLLPWPAAHL
eukprot:1160494-Pelagomonas_calceolata.AAC.12